MAIDIDGCLAEYRSNLHHLRAWAESIRHFFEQHPAIATCEPAVVHSIRLRLKDETHLKDKLIRKAAVGDHVTPERLLSSITDLAGVRVLHLYQMQFDRIHAVIRDQLDRGDWTLYEEPVAYTWDPESTAFFEGLGLKCRVKDSYYTSIHYVHASESQS